MSETRGVFSLSRVFAKKRNNQWVSLDDVWIDGVPTPTPNTGYFGGGLNPGTTSTMDKLTYSSDTTAEVPGAALSVARRLLAATGNSTAGYFGGGLSPSLVSTMDKTTYSTDTTAEVPGAALSVARYGMGATGNSTAGYFGGGRSPSGYFSTMDKVTYSSDTTAEVPGAALSSVRNILAATGNSTSGYFGGGISPGLNPYSTMDKLTYSTDTTAEVPGAALSAARYSLAATGNSTAGYFGGGQNPNIFSTMDKLTYSSDTTAEVPGAALSVARYDFAATGNSTAGYFGGGNTPVRVSTMDKMTYSSETTAEVPSAALSSVLSSHGASSSRANALPETTIPESTRFSDGLVEDYPSTGYNGGGNNVGNNMHRIQYVNDLTLLLPSSLLNAPRREFSAVASTTAGYFGGGRYPSPLSSIEKITFSTETTAEVPGAAFAATRYGSGSAGNLTQGYFAGGNPGQATSTYKLTYSSETSALAPSAPLTHNTSRGNSGTGTLTAGYFAHGTGPSDYSTIDKITYSTDTSTSNVSSESAPLYVRGATGNSTHGYFGGGYGAPGNATTVDKITYSSETTAQSPSASLVGARRYCSATGNTSQGYFLGGFPSSATEKLTYSTETTAQSPSAFLSSSDYRTASCSRLANALPSAGLGPDAVRYDSTPTPQTVYNIFGSQSGPVPSTGFTFGGNPSTDKIEEINFSTETFRTLTSTLTDPNLGGTALGNSTAGYYTRNLKIDKLIYAAGTKSLLPATTTRTFYHAESAGNSTFGYFVLGAPGYRTDVDKLTYSTETNGLVSGLQFSVGRNGIGSVSSTTHAYFGGGYEYPPGGPGSRVTTVNKIQYSNDTLSTISSPLSAARNYLTGTGNSTQGYFVAGYITGPSTATDKLVYSTDTTAAVPTAFRVNPMTARSAGNTSTTAGYYSGGYGTNSNVSLTERLTYSTDTMVQVPGTNLSEPKSHMAGRGPLSNALSSSAQVAVPTPVYL